jgi:hypothetical protein
MVIISWNMAKTQSVPFEEVLKLCERWEASVLVVQEPTGSLKSFASSRGSKSTMPRGCESSWKGWLEPGGSQGSIVIIHREGVEIGGVTPVDLGTGQGTRSITKTNPLVCFEAREGNETMTFATCHSPFDESARGTYSQKAVVAGGKRGTDCIIGDMNTYGDKVPSGTSSRSSGYQYPPLGATSNKGRGSPLDKVFVSDKQTNYLAGRLVPGGDRKPINPTPGRSDNVKDIIDPAWKQCFSDHLPIYVAFNGHKDRIADKFFKAPEPPRKKRAAGPDSDGDDPESPRKKRATGTDVPVAGPVEA